LKDFKLSLYVSQPSPGWQALPPLVLDSVPTHAAVARFDADSSADLAVTLTSGQVAVLPGQGDGRFGAPQLFAVGRSPERVAAGDVNGDDKVDILTVNRSTDDLSLLLGNGDGSFAPERRWPVGDNPSDLQLFDANGDILPDLLVSHLGSDFHSLLLGQAGGQLAPQQRIYSASNLDRVVLFDWNGDQRLDLASALGEGRVLIIPGGADGSFRTRTQLDVPSGWLTDYEVADLNGDARPEILVLNQRSLTIDVWEHAAIASGSGPLHSHPVGAQAERFVLADLNADRKPDLAVITSKPEFGGTGENRLLLLTGNGDGTFADGPTLSLSTAPSDVLAAEVDADGQTDLVVISGFSGQVTAFLNAEFMQFQAAPSFPVGGSILTALLQDINQDGRAELILAGYRNQGQQPFLATWVRGSEDVWKEQQVLSSAGEVSALAWADLSGTGKPELLAATANPQNGQVELLSHPQAGGSLGSGRGLAALAGWVSSIATGDLNGDGKLDLVLPSGLLLANAAGGFDPLQPFWLANAGPLRVVDLDGDSRLDVIGLADRAVVLLRHE
jgi:hypothetical protein